jgi:putative endonuclease
MQYFVYLLECDDKTIYTGITTDVERRLTEHKSNGVKLGAKYTRARGAGKILYTEIFKSRSEALKREAEIKSWRREKKLLLFS